MTARRTIRCKDGSMMTIGGEGATEADLALAEVLLEMAAERGTPRLELDESDFDEILRRLASKGYTPEGPIN